VLAQHAHTRAVLAPERGCAVRRAHQQEARLRRLDLQLGRGAAAAAPAGAAAAVLLPLLLLVLVLVLLLLLLLLGRLAGPGPVDAVDA
jgi:hypothetical protein